MKIMLTFITKISYRMGFIKTTFLIMRTHMPSTEQVETIFLQVWAKDMAQNRWVNNWSSKKTGIRSKDKLQGNFYLTFTFIEKKSHVNTSNFYFRNVWSISILSHFEITLMIDFGKSNHEAANKSTWVLWCKPLHNTIQSYMLFMRKLHE